MNTRVREFRTAPGMLEMYARRPLTFRIGNGFDPDRDLALLFCEHASAIDEVSISIHKTASLN